MFHKLKKRPRRTALLSSQAGPSALVNGSKRTRPRLNQSRGRGLPLPEERIEKGQFTCDSIGGGAIQVKFDEGSVRTYTCRTPSDGMTNVISVWPSRRFVEALKRSHRAIIEAEFTEGEQQLAFNKTGLKW